MFNLNIEITNWLTSAKSYEFDIFENKNWYDKEKLKNISDEWIKMGLVEIYITECKVIEYHDDINYIFKVNHISDEWNKIQNKVRLTLKKLYYV